MSEEVKAEIVVTETKPAPLPNAGTPIIPVAWVPWLTALAVVAGLVASGPAVGLAFIPASVSAIAGVVLATLTALGIASPGLRK